MLRTDLLLGELESASSVFQWSDSELVRIAGDSPDAVLALVLESDERARRERDTSNLLAFPGILKCARTIDSARGMTALVFAEAGEARPLAIVHDLPEPALRAGLVSLLATLRFVHSRGFVHRRIDRSMVLVEPSGRAWLTGWADARPVSRERPASGVLGEVSKDLRDLARAFREALLRRPWPDPTGSKIHERDPRTPAGQELIDAGVKVDRDFARVLSRLVADDPREAYGGATDVLADVGATEATAFDPWECVAPIGIHRDVLRVIRLLDATRVPASEAVRHAASVDFHGPDGSGKSRLLAEIARLARPRDVIVLTAGGGARGPWGGVGAFARQLVQLLGRNARICVKHEEALSHLLDVGDADARADEATRGTPGVDGRNPLISLCTAAMTDLVRFAFRRTPGLLLLDDEDQMPAAARQVWRATGRYAQTVNSDGETLHALLVSTSTRAYPAELGVDRISVELRPWQPRDVEQFLASAFAAPGGARDVGAAVHRIAGGRPGDVVGYLREMERRGVLVREGLRWSPAAPLSAFPPLTGGVSEQVRRSLEAAGRDAGALAECLAVARDVPLPRSTLSELCGLNGPRFAAAADAASAAGLVVLEGASWRVRTEAVRHKIYAAIPDERRRILHREVLSHLLDSAPDAIDSIASHARAGADPRAETWTREAVDRAAERGAWEIALLHLDEAVMLAGGSFAGPNAELQRGEILTQAGRLSEAMESLEALLPKLPPGEQLEGGTRLALARACYEAREWERVLAISLPEPAARSEQLAEMRYIRAAALHHLNRAAESRRESRLAGAELDGFESVEVALARLECDYQGCFYARDLDGVRRHLLGKLRIDVRLPSRHRFIADLVKFANALRVCRLEGAEIHPIGVRAVRLCRTTPGVSAMTKVALHTVLGFLSTSSRRHSWRHLTKAHQRSVQVGLGPYVAATRIRAIAAGIAAGRCRYSDKQFLIQIAEDLTSMSPTTLVAIAVDLSTCLLYYGHQLELERLMRRVELADVATIVRSWVHATVIMGRIMLDERLEPWLVISQDSPEHPAVHARTLISSLANDDFNVAVIAHFAINGHWGRDDWPEDWTVSRLVEVANTSCFRGWGGVFLALCLALWIPVPFDESQWNALHSIVKARQTPLPVGLEWQRLLLESRRIRRDGDWRGAERVKQQAERQLALLLRPEHGAMGRDAYARWRARLDAQNLAPRIARATVAATEEPGRSNSNPVDVCGGSGRWSACAAGIGETGLYVLTSPHRRELEVFVERALTGRYPENRRWRGTEAVDGARLAPGARIVVEFPNLWSSAQLRSAACCLSNHRESAARVISLLTVPMTEFRDRGPEERALAELIDGTIIPLPSPCSDEAGRGDLFLKLARSCVAGVEVDEDVVSEVGSYAWPGGLGEMENVARAALEVERSRISKRSLMQTGWDARRSAADDGLTESERAILGVVRDAASAVGVTQIAAETDRPVRTVLRHLTGLVRDGRVLRSGRGRATRYRLPRRDGSARA
jgi:hypothetical protein